ncbi:MAG: hypothetical protein LAT67_04015 [Balneolales bacterium]|nr:hypothetical protein [Balneolales bacterium]
MIGFLAATVFFVVWGGAPVASGTKEVEVEDRIQVKLSTEVEAAIQKKIDAAIAEMLNSQKVALSGVKEKADALTKTINDEISKIKSDLGKVDVDKRINEFQADIQKKQSAINEGLGKATQALTSEVQRVKEDLAKSDIKGLQKEFGSFVASFDAEKTKATIADLMQNIKATESSIKQLSTDSSKLEKTVQTSEKVVGEQSSAVLKSLEKIRTEIDKTYKQFAEFNKN